MTLDAVLGVLNASIALAAIYFALVALRVSRATLELEKEAVAAHRLERRLEALDELARAVYELGLQAGLSLWGKKTEAGSVEAARAGFQVAFRAVDEDLPECKKLATEAELEKITILTVHASSEIAVVRRKLTAQRDETD